MLRIERILWAGLLLQAALAIWVSQPWMTGDSPTYLALAEGLRHGGYGTFANGLFQPDALRPPGYPIILALWPFGTVALMALQEGLYLLSLHLARRIGGRWVLGLALVYPFPAMYAATIGTEAWAMLVVTLCAWLVIRDDWKSCALAGFVAGVGTMFRSDLLLLPVFIAFYVAIRNWRLALAPVLAATATLLPYSLWNLSHFGTLSPTPRAGALGNSLYTASWQPHLSRDDLNALYQGRATPAAERSGLASEVRRLNRQMGAPELTAPWNPASYREQEHQIESVAVFGKAAIDRIRDDPGSYAGHIVRNVWALWNTAAYPELPTLVKIGLQLSSAVVWVLGLAGLFLTPRRLWGALAVFLYIPAIHVWLHTEARYTASVRPLLLVFATLTIAWLLSRLKSRSGRATEAAPAPN